jgi:hypothetical protein
MKHIFLTVFAAMGMLASQQAVAQTAVRAQAPASMRAVKVKRPVHNHTNQNESLQMPLQVPNPTVHAEGSRSFGPEVKVGQTLYDLQTNNSVNYRIENHGDGTISTSWTYSRQEQTWTERGMAYHYFDGTNWTKNPDYEQVDNILRVENVRTGFGSLARVTGVGDIIVSHETAINALAISRNVSLNSESWSLASNANMPLIWPRMRVAGPDGKTVHIIGLTEPSGGTFA